MGHSKVVNTVAIRHTRPFRAVTGADDNSLVFSNGVPFVFNKTIHDHTRFVQEVKFSHNGDMFASVGSDGKVPFSRMERRRRLFLLYFAQTYPISHTAFHDRSFSMTAKQATNCARFRLLSTFILEVSLRSLGLQMISAS